MGHLLLALLALLALLLPTGTRAQYEAGSSWSFNDTSPGMFLGGSIAFSGNVVALGGPGIDPRSSSLSLPLSGPMNCRASTQVVLLQCVNGKCVAGTTLRPGSTSNTNACFGFSVALAAQGTFLAVGAPSFSRTTMAASTGAVFVYECASYLSCSQPFIYTPAVQTNDLDCGFAVAAQYSATADVTSVVLACPGYSSYGGFQIMQCTGTTTSCQVNPTTGVFYYSGYSTSYAVAIANGLNFFAVGSAYGDVSTFQCTDFASCTTSSSLVRNINSNYDASRYFGRTVALTNTILAVGDYSYRASGALGGVYLFRCNGSPSSCATTAVVILTVPNSSSNLGYSISLVGTMLLVSGEPTDQARPQTFFFDVASASAPALTGSYSASAASNNKFLNAVLCADGPQGAYFTTTLPSSPSIESYFVGSSCSAPFYNCIYCLPGNPVGVCQNTCPAGTLLTNMSVCAPCLPTCASCAGSVSQCTSCSRSYPYMLGNNQCVSYCPSGYTTSNSTCTPCTSNCRTCGPSASTCQSCIEPFFAHGSQCLVACPTSTFVSSFYSCSSCSSNCSRCESSTLCTTCAGAYWLDGDLCSACSFPCNNCDGSATTCTSCRAGYSLNGNRCLINCAAGSYPVNDYTACNRCSSTCLTCQDSANYCTSCGSGMYFLDNQCFAACPSGTYASGTSCLPCIDHCADCTTAFSNVCLNCEYGFMVDENGLCVRQTTVTAVYGLLSMAFILFLSSAFAVFWVSDDRVKKGTEAKPANMHVYVMLALVFFYVYMFILDMFVVDIISRRPFSPAIWIVLVNVLTFFPRVLNLLVILPLVVRKVGSAVAVHEKVDGGLVAVLAFVSNDVLLTVALAAGLLTFYVGKEDATFGSEHLTGFGGVTTAWILLVLHVVICDISQIAFRGVYLFTTYSDAFIDPVILCAFATSIIVTFFGPVLLWSQYVFSQITYYRTVPSGDISTLNDSNPGPPPVASAHHYTVRNQQLMIPSVAPQQRLVPQPQMVVQQIPQQPQTVVQQPQTVVQQQQQLIPQQPQLVPQQPQMVVAQPLMNPQQQQTQMLPTIMPPFTQQYATTMPTNMPPIDPNFLYLYYLHTQGLLVLPNTAGQPVPPLQLGQPVPWATQPQYQQQEQPQQAPESGGPTDQQGDSSVRDGKQDGL